MRAHFRSIVKCALIGLYCYGLTNIAFTQYLIDRFALGGD